MAQQEALAKFQTEKQVVDSALVNVQREIAKFDPGHEVCFGFGDWLMPVEITSDS